jgi:S1-C subfamily serine protease
MKRKIIIFKLALLVVFSTIFFNGCDIQKRIYRKGFYIPDINTTKNVIEDNKSRNYNKNEKVNYEDNQVSDNNISRDQYGLYTSDILNEYKYNFIDSSNLMLANNSKSIIIAKNEIKPQQLKRISSNNIYNRIFQKLLSPIDKDEAWRLCGKDYDKGLKFAKRYGWMGFHRYYIGHFGGGLIMSCLALIVLIAFLQIFSGVEGAAGVFVLFGIPLILWWLLDIRAIKKGKLHPNCNMMEIYREEEYYKSLPSYEVRIENASKADGIVYAFIQYPAKIKSRLDYDPYTKTYYTSYDYIDPFLERTPKINWNSATEKIISICQSWGYKDFRVFDGSGEKEFNKYSSSYTLKFKCQCTYDIIHKDYFADNGENKRNDNQVNEIKGYGTGFLVQNNGYIITNYHVVKNANKIKVIDNNKNISFNAEIIEKDISNDLALLKVMDQKFLTLGYSVPYTISKSPVKISDRVFCLGYPDPKNLGTKIKYVEGIISALTGFKDNFSNIQITAPVYPGNSGSPLFNEKGELIGVIVAKYTEGDNVNYAIKKDILEIFLKENKIALPSITPMNSNISKQDKIEKIMHNVFLIVVE